MTHCQTHLGAANASRDCGGVAARVEHRDVAHDNHGGGCIAIAQHNGAQTGGSSIVGSHKALSGVVPHLLAYINFQQLLFSGLQQSRRSVLLSTPRVYDGAVIRGVRFLCPRQAAQGQH